MGVQPLEWPSLTDQFDVAADLFGARGHGLVTGWLDQQLARVDDSEFAREFSDHVQLPGVASADYAHRMASTTAGKLLGGIRFKGRDIGLPFVEVVAHTFVDIDALRDCVRTEWSTFTPLALRLTSAPGRVVGPHAQLDQSVHAARYGQMRRPAAGVSLAPFTDVEEAVALVRRRYEHLAAHAPNLARNVARSDEDDLRAWHDGGQLLAVHGPGGTIVGALAVAPGAFAWLEGDEVMEEVIDVAFAGRGHAARAQAAWAHGVAANPDTYLVGTIARLNAVSRATAERAGRPRRLETVFVSLAEGPNPLFGVDE